jgi:NitT/TauT family transport system substrate-binding protein
MPHRPTAVTRRRAVSVVATAAAALLLGACGSDSEQVAGQTGPAAALRLGYFANVTHAPALAGVAQGFFAKELGSTKLSTQVFNAGPAAIEALNAGAIDAAYLGPNPAINGFVKSKGEALRIIAGATSGGAQLVVRPDITSAAQLKGTNLATPQLGGTQDVALRAWLSEQGLKTTPGGGGDVSITPSENAQTLQLFQDGRLDGAWLPEPWASRLVLDAGAKVLVDEKTLWPKGEFVTTHLIVAKKYLDEHPQTVEALLRGHVQAVAWVKDTPDQAPDVVNAEIAEAAGKPLSEPVITRAFANIAVTNDPLAGSLAKDLADGVTAGVVKDADLKGIYDLRLLNKVLTAQGQPTVSSGGLGPQ